MRKIHYEQIDSIPGMEGYLNLLKLISAIHHIIRVKYTKRIIPIDGEKEFNEIQSLFITKKKKCQQTRERETFPQSDKRHLGKHKSNMFNVEIFNGFLLRLLQQRLLMSFLTLF